MPPATNGRCECDSRSAKPPGSFRRRTFRNVSGNSSGSSFATFVDGVLTLDHEPCTNLDDTHYRQEGVQKALEAEPELRWSTDPLSPFLETQARGVEATLHALLRISGRRQAGIPLLPPRVTVTLRSGNFVQGIVRDILEDPREGRSLLLHEDRDGDGGNAVIVNLSHIETLAVQDVAGLGALKRDAAPVPSQLQLRRQLAKLGERLRAVTEQSITLGLTPGADATSAEDLRALAFIAERACEALTSLAKDGDARTALREKVQRVHLRADTQSTVTLSKGTLEFVISRKPAGWRTRAELEEALPPIL